MNAPCDIVKRREIVFDAFPPGQMEQALELLAGLPELEVRRGLVPHTLEITYRLDRYHLEAIETALQAQGFHLCSALLTRIRRALIYYCERTQLENMASADWPCKNYGAFVWDWEKRPHGDHDDTPAEWRQYR